VGRHYHEVAKSEKDTHAASPSCVCRVVGKEQRQVSQSSQKRAYGEPVDQCSVFENDQFSVSLCALAWIVIGGKLAMVNGDGV
jgi:hypothetical protein